MSGRLFFFSLSLSPPFSPLLSFLSLILGVESPIWDLDVGLASLVKWNRFQLAPFTSEFFGTENQGSGRIYGAEWREEERLSESFHQVVGQSKEFRFVEMFALQFSMFPQTIADEIKWKENSRIFSFPPRFRLTFLLPSDFPSGAICENIESNLIRLNFLNL